VPWADFSNFNLFEQYSCAAYCPRNINKNGPLPLGTIVTCPQSYCPSVNSAATVMLGEFESSGITDVTGYIAADTTNKLIIVSFRGSSSILNWITDLQVELTDNDICSGCQAHLGFFDSWVEAQSEVIDSITTGFDLYPNYQLVVTGHSLGGAVATIAAAELRNGGYSVALVSLITVLPPCPIFSVIELLTLRIIVHLRISCGWKSSSCHVYQQPIWRQLSRNT
jgi:hypothetical protein